MALRGLETFWGNDASAWVLSGDNIWGTGRYGENMLQSRFISSSAKRPIWGGAMTEGIIGWEFWNGNGGSNPMLTLTGDGGTVTHVVVSVTSGGVFTITIGSTLVATGTLAYYRAGWNNVETKFKIDDTAGYVEVRVGGILTPVVQFTGDTRNGGTAAAVDYLQLNFLTGCWIGAIYALDTTGTRLNDFIGEQKLIPTVATGAGSNTGMTPSTGANWSNTDESTPSTSDYNSSGVSGTKDTYAFGDVSGVSTINAVQTQLYAHKGDTDPISIKPAVKVGGTLYYGAVQVLSSTMTKFTDLWPVNPATGVAWTVSEFNAAEFGAEVV